MGFKGNYSELKGWLYGAAAGAILFIASCKESPVESPVEPPAPPPPRPEALQTVTLQNSVDISYTARVKYLDEPRLSLTKNGNLILSRVITDSVYSETFSYSTNKDITKGNYAFTLAGKSLAGKDTSITANVTVPNYSPEFSLSGLQADFDEDSLTSVDLESRIRNSDKNPEDKPVALAGVVSLDGKTEVIVNGYSVTIKGRRGQTGTYTVRMEAGSDAGGKNTSTLQGNIYDLLDVEGVLEDNEMHSRQQGAVRVYDSNNRKLGEIQVTASGQFSKRLGQRISDLTNDVLIQARRIENGENKSYIRTVKLPKGDIKGFILRVVPYDALAENGISIDDFRKHMVEVTENTLDMYGVIIKNILFKWDFGEFNSSYLFKEILISKQPSNSTLNKYFSQATAENIKSRILDAYDIGAWFRGKINNTNQVRIVESYVMDYNSPRDYGKMVVYPSNLNGAGFQDINGDGYIELGEIEICVNSNGEVIVPGALTHEFGHVSGLSGHAQTLSQEKTIMRAFLIDLNYFTPRFADKKAVKAIYEDTYEHGQGNVSAFRMNNLLGLDYVLGLKWADE
ncbi:MAG: hypothetical protein Q8P51_18415 [Ignavibacteria bacterium]|nr:hypothetical protein [Ignavibacteria bacterium]